jgi:chromosome segregation ATPase
MKKEKDQPEVDEKEDMADGPMTEQEHEDETLAREVESGRIAISNLEQALTLRDNEIADLKSALNQTKSESEELSGSLERAVTAYKELALQANPGVLAELITGNTIEEINESFKNARDLLDRVRQGIEMETAQTKIPPGAPQRSVPDISLLSPREKIQRALEGSS